MSARPPTRADTPRSPASSDGPPGPPAERAGAPRFLSGSITRHILVMTGTSAIGLMAVFVGELASLFFLGLLGDVEVLAALGYAMTVLFFATSIGIGMSIATTAAVAPAVGARDMVAARRLATHAVIYAALAGGVIAALLFVLLGPIVGGMGARGRTYDLAYGFLAMIIPTMPLTVVAMSCMSVMRSLGDADRAMRVPLVAALVQFAFEPFCIFMLKLGMTGAALAMIAGRIAFAAYGLIGAFVIHRMFTRPSLQSFAGDARALTAVAVPAMATNVATPVANLFTTAMIARFGDAAVAAWAIAGRLTPVAFGVVFSLSGAIGPILGQNFGAGQAARVRETFASALRVNVALCLLATLALILAEPILIKAFGVSARTAELVRFYCLYVAPMFLFLGMLFVANAAFNVLGYPHYGTLLNWGRATLGTIPLVWIGGQTFGAEGAFLGSTAGGIVFGFVSVWLGYRILPAVPRA